MLLTHDLSALLIIIPIFMISIGLHEAAHAYSAAYFGDDTPAKEGRLTINPIAHLDLMGSLMLVIAGFGWGKSVNVDPRNLRNANVQMPLIAAAGPFANLLLVIVSVLLMKLVHGSSLNFLTEAMGLSALLNAFLMFLNLLPIPPLDGSKVIRPFLPHKIGLKYDEWAPYGFVVFLGLLFLPGISTVFMKTLHNLSMGTIGFFANLVGM